MQIMTPEQVQALTTGFGGLDFASINHRDEPPTLDELRAMRLIMEGWWILYVDDIDNLPNGEPKNTWLMMLGATHDEMIAAGMAAVWP